MEGAAPAPEVGVDELHGDQRSAGEDDVVSVGDIVPQPLKECVKRLSPGVYKKAYDYLCDIGVGVPDRHVMLHWRNEQRSAALLREIPESCRLERFQEVRVAIFSACNSGWVM